MPAADEFVELMGRGIALGFDRDAAYEDHSLADVPRGAVFLLATDGLWEARNARGAMFGKETVKSIIRANAASSAQDIKHRLLTAVEHFIGGHALEDDLTIVVAKFE
jgi:sigma-B regulation protein RsbU (phosphoserine phosphatase)